MGCKNMVGLCVIFAFLLFMPCVSCSYENDTCVFCDIIDGNSRETRVELETRDFVIFKDIKPVSKHHYLIVPKRHIVSLLDLTKKDIKLVERMETIMKKFFVRLGIDTTDALFGFHLPPFISVNHIHMHGIAPRSRMTFIDRIMFQPGSNWFKTVSAAKKYLKHKE